MANKTVDPWDDMMNDTESQEPEPLEKGTKCEIQITGGAWDQAWNGLRVYVRPTGEHEDRTISSPVLKDPTTVEQRFIKATKRDNRRFCEIFGILPTDVRDVLIDAKELYDNEGDSSEAVQEAGWTGLTASIVSTVDKNGYAQIARKGNMNKLRQTHPELYPDEAENG